MLTGGASAPFAAATRPRMSRVRGGQSSLSLGMRQQADRDVSDRGSDAPDSPTNASIGSSSYSIHSGSSDASSTAPAQLLASPRLDQGQQLSSSQLLESDQGVQGASFSGDVSASPVSADKKHARRSVKVGEELTVGGIACRHLGGMLADCVHRGGIPGGHTLSTIQQSCTAVVWRRVELDDCWLVTNVANAFA